MNSISLYELNRLVRRTLEDSLCHTLWLRTEISELHVNRHCYLEFVQKDSRGNAIIAKARGQIWANRWYIIKSHFEHVTGQELTAGMEVLVQVEVTFHELFGYSLNVVDIDPTFTLGDIARKRLEIIRVLKEEGVFDMNKELPLPRMLQRIAIISSSTAAGYGDFCDQLSKNKLHLAFHTRLFPATMQGKDVEQSIIAALERIAQEIDEWDIVVIIRGGGSTTDLSGFDSLQLAENIAQFPIPIITGIGHERDDTIIDLVSHTRVKTPTAAAEFLIHHQEMELNEIEDLQQRLLIATSSILQDEKRRLTVITGKLPTLFEVIKQRETARLDRALMNMHNLISQRTYREHTKLEILDQRIVTGTNNMLNNLKHQIETIDIKLDSADPQRILNLGFSITRIDGKSVRDASTLQAGQTIETSLQSGTITSIIQ